MRRLLLLLTATFIVFGGALTGAEIVFTKDVKPILQAKCYGCHGPLQQMGSLRLDRKESAMVAGRGEPVIVPGSSSQSQVYRRISGSQLGPQMPLTGPLSAAEIALIKDWIDQGAQWPDEPRPRTDWKTDPRLTPLFSNAREGQFAQIRAAVEADPSLLRSRRSDGTTLLMQATLYGSAADIQWLLSKGANANMANTSGATALMWATEDAAKVRALVLGGADVKAHSADGHTALLIACEEVSDPEIVKLLLEHGAQATADQGIDPLVLAARNADLKSMELLAERRGGKYPPGALTGAAAADCLACVRKVLEGDYSKDAASAALVNAATTSSIEMLNVLLAAGADVNATDWLGATPLMHAAYSDYAETERVRLLLDRGAAMDAHNKKGESALHIARTKGATKVVAMLVSAGAKE